MRTLAAAPNVAAKISGLAMFHHGWTPEIIRPFVLDTIELTGTAHGMTQRAILQIFSSALETRTRRAATDSS